MDWKVHYPEIESESLIVRHLDIGCGFGGLTIALANMFPDKLVLGMEIRAKVCEYVRLRIEALRKDCPGSYQNAGCLRTNCMRYLPNFFVKGQIEKIFICFPDPHFKAKNHRRRIVSDTLLSEYAYFLCPSGRLYLITDVEELHRWHVACADVHPMFRKLPKIETDADPVIELMLQETEESKKVARIGGRKHYAVYERIRDDDAKSDKSLKILELFPHIVGPT